MFARRGAWAAAGAVGAASVCIATRRAACDAPEAASPTVRGDERAMFKPSVPYPHWDQNWDGLDSGLNVSKKSATTRHILLVRHGQYDESSKDDAKRVLTPLGRAQAIATGERLAEMLVAAAADSPIDVRVSTLTRAKETMELIWPLLPARTTVAHPDPRLSEGRPSHVIPGAPFAEKVVASDGARIESAFRSIFKRAQHAGPHKHEYEIVVCHGNVIRYMSMRALQLPPEARRLKFFSP